MVHVPVLHWEFLHVFPQVPCSSISIILKLRQRIAGAKSYCMDPARSDSHSRPGPLLSDCTFSINGNRFDSLSRAARKNMYDGALEFWVTVREHGAFEEAHEVEERRRSVRKATFAKTVFFQIFELLKTSIRIKFGPFHACHSMQADEPVEIPTGSFDKVKALQDKEKLAAPAGSGSGIEAKCAEAGDFSHVAPMISQKNRRIGIV